MNKSMLPRPRMGRPAGPKIQKICDNCSGEFEVIPSRSGSRFCSVKCRGLFYRGKAYTKRRPEKENTAGG